MISMIKQLAFDYADLRYLELTCSSCSARMQIDAKSKTARPPAQCHACGEKFDIVAIQNPIHGFIDIYKLLTSPGQKAKFRIIVDDEEPTAA